MTLIATRGFLGPLIVTCGFGIGAPIVGIVTYADPRQGTVLSPDTSPLAVDPRQGTLFSTDVDARQGTDTGPDPDARQGTVIN